MAPVGWLIESGLGADGVGTNADPDRPSDLERRSKACPPMRYATIVKRDPLLETFSRSWNSSPLPEAPLADVPFGSATTTA